MLVNSIDFAMRFRTHAIEHRLAEAEYLLLALMTPIDLVIVPDLSQQFILRAL